MGRSLRRLVELLLARTAASVSSQVYPKSRQCVCVLLDSRDLSAPLIPVTTFAIMTVDVSLMMKTTHNASALTHSSETVVSTVSTNIADRKEVAVGSVSYQSLLLLLKIFVLETLILIIIAIVTVVVVVGIIANRSNRFSSSKSFSP